MMQHLFKSFAIISLLILFFSSCEKKEWNPGELTNGELQDDENQGNGDAVDASAYDSLTLLDSAVYIGYFCSYDSLYEPVYQPDTMVIVTKHHVWGSDFYRLERDYAYNVHENVPEGLVPKFNAVRWSYQLEDVYSVLYTTDPSSECRGCDVTIGRLEIDNVLDSVHYSYSFNESWGFEGKRVN